MKTWFRTLGNKVAAFQARLILSAVYYVIVVPFAFMKNLGRPDGDRLRSGWQAWPLTAATLEDLRRQW